MIEDASEILDKLNFDSVSKAANLDRTKYLDRTNDFIRIMPKDLSVDCHALEIGVGSGWFSILLHELYGCKVVEAIGLSNDEKFVKNYMEFTRCDITKGKLPYPDDSFDLVLFMEVLEHLICTHPPYFIFDEIYRIMNEKAYLIFSTPNFCSIHNRISMLFGSNPSYWPKSKKREPVQHIREYTKKELVDILKESNFKILDIILTQQSPPPKSVKAKGIRLPFHVAENIYPLFRNTIMIKAQKER